MLGASTGSLSLRYIKFGTNNSMEVWRRDGNQGIFWNHAQVSVHQHQLYQVNVLYHIGCNIHQNIETIAYF